MHRRFLSRVRELVSSAEKLLGGRLAGKPSHRPPAEIGPYISRILSDAILFNEIPSPTERESARTEFILQRLAEVGYPNSECDDLGNVTAVLPARGETDEHVLVFASIRCEEYSPLESMARLEPDRLWGRGVTESAIPAASLIVLAEYLGRNEIQYDRNVIFLFTAHDPGELDAPALEGFLGQWRGRLHCAAYVRGLELGGVGDRPLGTCKLSVKMRTPEYELMAGAPAVSAISALAAVAGRLGGIRWDGQNATFLNIARIEAGSGFGWFASEGEMEIEVFSPDAAALEVAKNVIVATVNSVAAEMTVVVDLTLKAFLPPGDPSLNAELSAMVKAVHEKLRIASRPMAIPTTAALLSSQGIPAVTLGMADGKNSVKEECVQISSLETGFRQLLLFLEASAVRREGDDS
jgi:acetylornithine deacetylase/succinyl-diaminopimelate desuccinylase-like protein